MVRSYLPDLLLEDINKPLTHSLVHLDILKISNGTGNFVLQVLVLQRVQTEDEGRNFRLSVDYLKEICSLYVQIHAQHCDLDMKELSPPYLPLSGYPVVV